MKCQSCGEGEPQVTRIDIVNGKKRVLKLCAQCAASAGFVVEVGPATVAKKVGALQELLGGAVPVPTVPTSAPRTCPACDISWGEFKKTRRLGCPEDWEVFHDALERVVEQVHGATRHVGRIPATRARHLAEAAEEADRAQRIDALQSSLDEAVASEDYERAAELRDRLRQIGGGPGSAHGTP